MSYLKKFVFFARLVISLVTVLAFLYAFLFSVMDIEIATGFVHYFIETCGQGIALAVGIGLMVSAFVTLKTFEHLEALDNDEFDRPFSGDRIVRHH